MTCPEPHSWGDAQLKLAPCLFESQTHFQAFYSTCFLDSWEPIAQQQLSGNPIFGGPVSRSVAKQKPANMQVGAEGVEVPQRGAWGQRVLWEC